MNRIPKRWSFTRDLPAFFLGWAFVALWIASPWPPSPNLFMSLAVFVIVFTSEIGLAIFKGWWPSAKCGQDAR